MSPSQNGLAKPVPPGDLSGVHPLSDAHDAFAARMMLIQTASYQLDLQYYIWENDTTGNLLLCALVEAADRGVRVRLLLDDHGTIGLDDWLAALQQHEQIRVRLFNPYVQRRSRWLSLITDFRRLNRRMHNKSMTADGKMTIVGGRNIGDEYFAAIEGRLFADLDVLVTGPVVDAVADDFERYWQCAVAVPVEQLLASPQHPQALSLLQQRARQRSTTKGNLRYLDQVANSDLMHAVRDKTLDMHWTRVTMVSDPPEKVLARARRRSLITHQLQRVIGEPRRRLALISPYFVPTRAGAAAFVEMAKRGVEIDILTNSLSATDAAIVHAGYAKHRKTLLQAGIRLYELRRQSPLDIQTSTRRHRGGSGPLGSGAASLHAKTFAVDGRQLFVGSFNFDPRSATLNTELGFVIEDAGLAEQIHNLFGQQLQQQAYRLGLENNNRIFWQHHNGEHLLVLNQEPETIAWQRAGLGLLSHLPIDWLL